MYDHRFDGEEFELDDMDAFYETFNDLPEHHRKGFLKEIYDLDHVKYENFVKWVLSRHPDYDPEKYKIEE